MNKGLRFRSRPFRVWFDDTGEGSPFNFLGRRAMKSINASGAFFNTHDNLADPEQGFSTHFAEYATEMVGHVAFFVGRK
jgi:hypothetical protein